MALIYKSTIGDKRFTVTEKIHNELKNKTDEEVKLFYDELIKIGDNAWADGEWDGIMVGDDGTKTIIKDI